MEFALADTAARYGEGSISQSSAGAECARIGQARQKQADRVLIGISLIITAAPRTSCIYFNFDSNL